MFTRKYLLCETLCHSVVNPPNNFKTMNNEINTLNRQKGAILLLDNYDSFTYNLLHVVKEQGVTDIEVFRNDEITLDEVERFDKIILSPGPGIPEEAGLLLPIIRKYAATKSILGVCLGHQAIGEAFGATLENLTEVYHGVQTPVSILKEDILFRGLGREIPVGRYHSCEPQGFPRMPGDHGRKPGGTNHGITAPDVRRTWHSVSSRIGADSTGKRDNQELLKQPISAPYDRACVTLKKQTI